MSLINCRNLRFSVIFAFALVVSGLGLQIPRALFVDAPGLITLLSGLGLLATVLSPLLLIVTMLVSLLPGASRRLDTCNH